MLILYVYIVLLITSCFYIDFQIACVLKICFYYFSKHLFLFYFPGTLTASQFFCNYACEKCFKFFPGLVALSAHTAVCPGPLALPKPRNDLSFTRRYKCENCPKAYVHSRNLQRHVKYECGKEPQFSCLSCPYKAHHKGTLLSHMNTQHGGSKQNFFLQWRLILEIC